MSVPFCGPVLFSGTTVCYFQRISRSPGVGFKRLFSPGLEFFGSHGVPSLVYVPGSGKPNWSPLLFWKGRSTLQGPRALNFKSKQGSSPLGFWVPIHLIKTQPNVGTPRENQRMVDQRFSSNFPIGSVGEFPHPMLSRRNKVSSFLARLESLGPWVL